ncbi:MAG TPA: DUF1501 domain-containing protein [Ilumatobacter sp.]|nr:DUF1501 domain-containing protein [Ilumatobacter sp.]
MLPTDISTADALAHLSQAHDAGDDRDAHALDRRRFLQLVGMGAGAGLVAAGPGATLLDWFVPGHDPAAWALGPVGPNDGILVVLGLYGGNDGLNTIVPTGGSHHGVYLEQHGALAIQPQNTLALGANSHIVDQPGLAGNSGANSRLTEFKRLWDAGQLAIVEGVGYPDPPDLSHFSSMAKWMAARPTGLPDSGWLGRWLDGYTGGRADLYAGASVGSAVPLHVIGQASRATGVSDQAAAWGSATDTRSERGYQAVRKMFNGSSGPWHAATAQAFVDAFDVVAATAPLYPTAPAPGAPLQPEIITRMDVVARLINANLGFRVLTAGWADFDSHALQPAMHNARMNELNAAIARFYSVLHPGWASRVTVMTFSEFGRTSWANAGMGTDHGSAAPQFVFGANVQGGFYGARPELPPGAWDRMTPTVDVRSYYGSVIDGWLGGGSGDVLGGNYANLGLFRRPPGQVADGSTAPLPTVIGGLSTFVPISPARVIDTRDGTGGVPARPLAARGVLRVPIAGRGGLPPDGVTAVIANVTAVDATVPHYFTVYPGGTAKPATSNVNGGPGRAVPNLVAVGVGLDGSIEVFNSHGSAHCLVDVFGYCTSNQGAGGDRFVPLRPTRLFDTRTGQGVAAGKLAHLVPVEIAVGGQAGVPADATGVVMNLTATEPDAPGYLRLSPAGQPVAATSNVNFWQNDTVPNLAVVRLGSGGRVQLDGAGAGKHAVGDVFGYFTSATPAGAGRLRSVAPRRLLDTREGLGAARQPIGSGRTIDVVVARRAGVPEAATAVVLNVTVTNVTAPSYVTVWPAGEGMPGTSNLNLLPGQTLANLVICRLGAGGALTFANKLAECDVIADVFAYVVE